MDDELAKNLLAIWQSELTAMAADRELRESWVAMVQLWAQAGNAVIATFAHEPAPGSPLAPQPPRPTPAYAASGTRLDEVDRLNSRVAELERNLAALLAERDQSGPPGNKQAI